MEIKNFNVEKLRVRVFETRKELGDCAGKDIADAIKKTLKEKEYVNIIFAAAPSQNETLAALCSDVDIDWSRVNAFHMDEYVGLNANHPAGFRNFLKRAIFDKFNFHTVNLLNGNAANPITEAERYAKLLEENPVDICILGIGENGHIAFNDPMFADFDDAKRVKVVELDERCRMQQVHDGCFEKIDDVPTSALTITIPGLCAANHMFCSVPAMTKAEAVFQVINGEITTECPASIMRLHDDAILYLDRDSAALLK